MWCPRLASMQQMMKKFVLGWEMLMWKKFKVVYKKPLHGQKSLGNEGKNGSRLVLKMAWDIENWRPVWKPNSLARSSRFKKPLSLRMPYFFVIASKSLLLYNKKYLKPKCGLLLRQLPLLWILLYRLVWWIKVGATSCCQGPWQYPLPLVWKWKLNSRSFLFGLKYLICFKLKFALCIGIYG